MSKISDHFKRKRKWHSIKKGIYPGKNELVVVSKVDMNLLPHFEAYMEYSEEKQGYVWHCTMGWLKDRILDIHELDIWRRSEV